MIWCGCSGLKLLLIAVSFAFKGSTQHFFYTLVVRIGSLVAAYYGLVRMQRFAMKFAKWLYLVFFLD